MTRTSRWQLLVIAVAALCGCREERPVAPPPPPPPPPPPASAPQSAPAATQRVAALLKGLEGKVEVRRAGRWTTPSLGEPLEQDDVIRTAAAATAMLAMGDDIEVQLQASSEVTLRQLTATASRVRLERGRLGANVASTKVVLRVESARSTAIAEARRGRFAVFTDGEGLVAVTATAGQVRLQSSGGDTVLAAGQRGRVVNDRAPVREAIPASVYLKVKWPEAFPGARRVVVRGSADIGATVAINGRPAAVDATGSFTATVPVRTGHNQLQVVAVDLGGRTAKKASTLRLTSQPPTVKVEKPKWK